MTCIQNVTVFAQTSVNHSSNMTTDISESSVYSDFIPGVNRRLREQ